MKTYDVLLKMQVKADSLDGARDAVDNVFRHAALFMREHEPKQYGQWVRTQTVMGPVRVKE